MTVFIDATDR